MSKQTTLAEWWRAGSGTFQPAAKSPLTQHWNGTNDSTITVRKPIFADDKRHIILTVHRPDGTHTNYWESGPVAFARSHYHTTPRKLTGTEEDDGQASAYPKERDES